MNQTMMFVRITYLVIFATFFILPFYNINLWLIGILFGWVFHWIVGSIIIHRYITHRAFKVSNWLHNVMIVLSTLAFAGSSMAWASMHRTHHVTSDTEKDPHSPSKYTAYQLLTLDVDLKNKETELLNARDLLIDPIHIFCHRYYVSINVVFLIILSLISLNALMAFFVGIAYHIVGIFFSTYVYHKPIKFLQYRNHELKDNSQNNWLATLLFHGEAYHNNHHKNPAAISNAEKWYEFDMNKAFVALIRK